MIYKNNYFNKELKQSYIENEISQRKSLSFGVFLGLLSFSIHFILQTIYESVLSQSLPEIMLPSYFSVCYTFTAISFIFFILFFLAKYEYLTFAEIYKNRWYMLTKMGYRPVEMIFSKLLARAYSLLAIYTVGFVVSILLTTFLKYTFVWKYLLTLYISGLIDILVIVAITMIASLIFKQEGNVRYIVISSAVLIFLLKLGSGYYSIVSNRILMQNIENMFDFSKSIYIPVVGIIFILCIFTCIFYSSKAAKYFRLNEEYDKNIIIMNYKTGKINLFGKENHRIFYKVLNFASNFILIVFILAIILFNLAVLFVSVATPEKEISINGVIPYVFQSVTMEPTIMKNDLAFFKKVDVQKPLKSDEIVLFKDKEKVFVERIKSIDGDNIKVDIDFYPPLSQVGAMIKVISRDDIYGVYDSRNRWLGALILFTNTIFGRILFLLIPSFLIFFYKPILKFISKR